MGKVFPCIQQIHQVFDVAVQFKCFAGVIHKMTVNSKKTASLKPHDEEA